MSNFKYGDKVWVKNRRDVDWVPSNFIRYHNKKTLCTSIGRSIISYEQGDCSSNWWDECKEPEKAYDIRQADWVKEHDIKAGDKLIATRAWRYLGNGYIRPPERSPIHKSFLVDCTRCGSIGSTSPYNLYPYFVLEKVKETQYNVSKSGKLSVIGHVSRYKTVAYGGKVYVHVNGSSLVGVKNMAEAKDFIANQELLNKENE